MGHPVKYVWILIVHLYLGDNLRCRVHVLVVADGPPGHEHGDDENDNVGANNERHWTHEGPDEALLRRQPAVMESAITPEVQGLVEDDAHDDNQEGDEVANDVVGEDAKSVGSPNIS